jgi:hypothetical protein
MRVAFRRVLILAASLVLLQVASDVWPQATVRMSGLAYVDYRGKPRFKVGDWVKYRFTSKSDGGGHENYDMTILVAGEEKFWGDDCFWLETWTGGSTLTPQSTAFLMSYSAFGDTAWLQRLMVYQRKSVQVDDEGNVREELTRRVLGGKARGDDRPSLTIVADTLGRDTVHTAGGVYLCTKVQRRAGIGSVEEIGDSTIRNENWDKRTLYLSPRVPLTSLVREIDDRWITRKAWKPGHSGDAVQAYRMRGTGTLELLSFGSGGLTPKLVPADAQRQLFNYGGPRRASPAGTKAKRRG